MIIKYYVKDRPKGLKFSKLYDYESQLEERHRSYPLSRDPSVWRDPSVHDEFYDIVWANGNLNTDTVLLLQN